MNTTLRLGTAKIEITPESPMPLSGFEDRKGNFKGIRSPLYARIWLFQQGTNEGIDCKALLVQADLIWWGSDKVANFKQRISQLMGIDSVILHASHTHSGPQTTALFTPSLGLFHDEYISMVEDRLLLGIASAEENIEPVVVERGAGSCHIGINRRKFDNGKTRMKPNVDGATDPDVNVVRYTRLDGTHKGIMFHYTCHPTTTRENVVSSEFPGVAMERVEKSVGHSVMTTYLQGCCGDIRPALIHDDEFMDGTSEDVDALGETLARQVMDILNKPMERLVPQLHEIRLRQIRLPLATLPNQEDLQRLHTEAGVLSEWSQLLLNNPSRLQPDAELELCWLRIADGLSFIGINGEPVLQYGLAIKQLSGGKALPLGYTNGMIGYIPTAEQLAEGGYESMESYYYFGLPGPFSHEAEQMIIGEIKALLKEQVSV